MALAIAAFALGTAAIPAQAQTLATAAQPQNFANPLWPTHRRPQPSVGPGWVPPEYRRMVDSSGESETPNQRSSGADST